MPGLVLDLTFKSHESPQQSSLIESGISVYTTQAEQLHLRCSEGRIGILTQVFLNSKLGSESLCALLPLSKEEQVAGASGVREGSSMSADDGMDDGMGEKASRGARPELALSRKSR